MPQLDRIIVFSQIFWLFFMFSFLYIVLTHFFLPKFLKSIKSRKQIEKINSEEMSIMHSSSSKSSNMLKQTLIKNLTLIEETSTKIFVINDFHTKFQRNSNEIPTKLGLALGNTILHCSDQLLNSISFYPNLLNNSKS